MGIKRKIKKDESADIIFIDEAFDEFINMKSALNLSTTTIENYRISYCKFKEFNEFDSSSTTDEITPQLFYKWINTMRLEGLKPTSINHYLRDCRTFFYWCMDADRAYITPTFKIEMIKGQEEPLKLFTDDELDLLLVKPSKADSFTTWRTWAIVNWVLATGNRAATICNVKKEDIDFKKKEITLTHTKNKKAQTIPLSSSLETVIKEYTRVWLSAADSGDWLFPNVGTDKLTTNALKHSFAKYCIARNVSRTNIHGLRHNFAKIWVSNNGNIFKLQKVMGHSSLDMTRKYVKLFGDDLKEDYDKYSPLDNLKRSASRKSSFKKGVN